MSLLIFVIYIASRCARDRYYIPINFSNVDRLPSKIRERYQQNPTSLEREWRKEPNKASRRKKEVCFYMKPR